MIRVEAKFIVFTRFLKDHEVSKPNYEEITLFETGHVEVNNVKNK
jgi:hypothetical protein